MKLTAEMASKEYSNMCKIADDMERQLEIIPSDWVNMRVDLQNDLDKLNNKLDFISEKHGHVLIDGIKISVKKVKFIDIQEGIGGDVMTFEYEGKIHHSYIFGP